MTGAVDAWSVEAAATGTRRRRRVLHGRRPGPGARHQRPDAVKACAPFYGVIPWADGAARLVEARAPVRRRTSPRRTTASPRRRRPSSRRSCKALGKDVDAARPRRRRPRLLQRHPPRGLRRSREPSRVLAHRRTPAQSPGLKASGRRDRARYRDRAMSETVRIGVLGCGNVGGRARRAHRRAGRGRSRPGPGCASRWPGRRAQPRPASEPSSSRRACSPATPRAVVDDPDDRRRRRGDRRHRAGPRADPHRAQARASRSSRRTRSCSPTSAPSCSAPPTTAGVDLLFEAAVAGGIPHHPAAARVAARRAHPPRDGHRQRHDQLHPHPDDRGRAPTTATRWPRRRASATPSATRPPTSRASTPGAKAAIIAIDRVRRSRSSPATCTTRASAGITAADIAVRRRASATSSSCSPSPSAIGDDGEVARAGAPGDGARRTIRWPACATASTRCSSRATRSATLMFYGRGAGGRPTASAVLGDVIDAAVNLRKGTHASLGTFGQAPHPADRRDECRVLPRASRSPTGPACCTPSPACSRDHDVSHPRRWSRRASATRPASSSSPTRRREADVQATLARPARARRVVDGSVGAARSRVDRRPSVP